MPRSTWLHLIVMLAAIVTVTALVAAPVPDTHGAPAKESPAERIKKGLDQAINLDHDGSSLDTVLADIRKQTKINLVVDRMLIQQFGITAEQMPVSIKVQGAKARSVLRTVLQQYQLDYAVVGDSLMVSTESMLVYRQLKQRLPVDIHNLPLAAALKQLARDSGVHLLVDQRAAKDAQAPVSLQLDEVTVEAAVRLLVNQAGLKVVRVGNVLYVTSKGNAAELRADPELVPPGIGNDFPFLPEEKLIPGGMGIAPPGVLPNGAVPVPAPAAPAPAPPAK